MRNCNDVKLKSWVLVPTGSHFPIQNLPFGIFKKNSISPRVGVAIGEEVLDLAALQELGYFGKDILSDETVFHKNTLNDFMALGKKITGAVRSRVSELLDVSHSELKDNASHKSQVLHKQLDVEMLLPIRIGDYTDFYSSKEHATNVGTMFRDPTNALLPNWKHMPIGYHGRASSVIISGKNIRRPMGQIKPPNADKPLWSVTKQLDFELEMAFVVGKNNEFGNRVSTSQAEDYIFGMVVVNDWSARDIQTWEYQPLGPFLAKSFATSVSPWVVTLDALEPYRCAGPVQDVEVLPYLQFVGYKNFDIHLSVKIKPEKSQEAYTVCKSNFKYMYWNMCQQFAHHTSNGVNAQIGDLYASGTISGPTPDSYGSMLELAWKGTKPLSLPNGSTRVFIEDNDTVSMSGYCERDGIIVGFGEVKSTILPAIE